MEMGKDSPQPSLGDSGDSSQTQYKALRTSCDLCKRMKIKCQRQGVSCAHCIARHVRCDTTFIRRKKHVRVKRNTAVLGVEDRIKRLETVLTASGINPNGDPLAENSETPLDLTDQLSSLIIDGEGTSRFMGASSGFSLFSPQGLQWISEKTGNEDVSQFISKLARSDRRGLFPEQADLWSSLPPSEREPLPAKYVADLYIQCFFDTFNACLPLFDKATFNNNYDLQCSGKPPSGSAWYACLNIVICMGCMILQSHLQRKENGGLRTRGDPHQEQHWKYYRNACSCFVDLLFKDCNLMAVQALCGMAFIQQASFNPEPFYVLVSSAGRLAYRIGLHRKLDDFGMGPSEMDTRRNVLWIVYFLDKSLALRIGLPSIIVDDDIGVDLPPETSPLDKCPDGSKRFNIFRYMVQLAQLESRTFSELYSIRSRNRPAIERLKSVAQLDKALLEWRQALPIEIRPGANIQCSEEQLMPVIMMHFAYLNCHTTIHRIAIHHSSWKHARQNQTNPIIPDQYLDNRVHASEAICLTAARNSINLLRFFEGNSNLLLDEMILMILYYPLSSFIALFANILHNPQDHHVASDLQLMSFVTSFLAPMVTDSSPFTISASITLLRELGNVAARLVEKTNSQTTKSTPPALSDSGLGNMGPAPSAEPLSDKSSEADHSFSALLFNQSETPNLGTSYIDLPNGQVPLSTFPDRDLSTSRTQNQHGFDDQTYRRDLSAANTTPLPTSEGGSYSKFMSEAPIFSEYFEWDLVNLWKQPSLQDQ